MELNDAYQQVYLAHSEGKVPEDLIAIFDTPEEGSPRRALILSKVAATLGLWECAEIIRDDPILEGSVFQQTEGEKYSFLAIDAAKLGESERARAYFEKSDLSEESAEALITYYLIERDELDEAEDGIRKVDFLTLNDGMIQTNLTSLVYKIGKTEGGPRKALVLIKELVPDPKTSEIEDKKMEHSRLDYFLQSIAPAAITDNDFETAEEVIEMTHDWFGPGAAMGGGGLLDCAIDAEDKSVYPAITALIFRKWAAVNLHKQLTDTYNDIRPEVRVRIAAWLEEIKTKDYDYPHQQEKRDIQLPLIEELIELYLV